jgi:hypothetical protein
MIKPNWTTLFPVILLSIFFLGGCTKDDGNDDPVIPQDTLGKVEQVPDGYFESWKIEEQGNVQFEIPASGWWVSLNQLAWLGGPITCSKDSLVSKNGFCLKLQSRTWGTMTIPGLLAAGFFDSSAPIGENIIQGRAFGKRPSSLSALWRYSPAGADTAAISVNLTRWDSLMNQRDTIARLSYTSSLPSDSFISLLLPFDYVQDILPDSLHFVLISSLSGSKFLGQSGSTLWVDNLEFRFPSGKSLRIPLDVK